MMGKRTPVIFLTATLALLVGNAAAVPYTFTDIGPNNCTVERSEGFKHRRHHAQ